MPRLHHPQRPAALTSSDRPAPALAGATRAAWLAVCLALPAPALLAQAGSKPAPTGTPATAQAAAARATYGATTLELEVGGTTTTLRNCSPIGQRLDATTPSSGVSRERAKGGVACESVSVVLPATFDPNLAKWISEALTGSARRQDAAILECDATGKADGSAHRFRDLVIESFALSGLDAASKETLTWTLTLGGATSLRTEKLASAPKGSPIGKAKSLFCANFRLRIDGAACTAIRSIGSIEARCAIPAEKSATRATVGTTVAPFTVQFGDGDAALFRSWFDDASTKGTGAARNLTIELLDASLKDVQAKLELTGALPVALRRTFGESERVSGNEIELSASALVVTFPKS